MSEEIDFKRLYKSLLRKKKFIIYFTFFSFIFSTFYTLRQEHIWKGKFEIVLDKKNDDSALPNTLSSITSLINSNVEKGIQTEVEILKSSSVLFPVFDLSKKYQDMDKRLLKNYRFTDWQKNLNVELIPGTVILEVSYTNTNKESIIPILKKISDTYSIYSDNNRKRTNAKKVSFLNEQINRYKSKTLNSIRIAEDFSKKHNVTLIFEKDSGNVGSNQEEIIKKSNVEKIFLNDLLKLIEKDLNSTSYEDKLKTISNSLKKIVSFDSTPILNEIIRVEASLAKSEGILTNNDIEIMRLIQTKRELYKRYRESLIGIIKTKIEINNAQIASNNREDGIFTKSRELIREVKRNEFTLTDLENQKNTILLKSQIISEPWKIITKPELEKFPVGPRKKRMILLGSFLGLFIGSIIGILTDKKRTLIYNINEILNTLEVNLIENLKLSDEEDSEKGFKIIFENSFDNSAVHKIALLPVAKLSDNLMKNLQFLLEKIKTKNTIKVINDISAARDFEHIFLISTEGIINKKQLIKLKKRISLQKLNISGLIQINE